MTDLGKVMVVPKGAYNANTTYEILDLVTYNGSSYIALKNTKGNVPTNTTYWQLHGQGYPGAATGVSAKDTQGMVVTAGSNSTVQALIDAIADKVMTKLLAKTDIVQTESTATDKVPSSAYLKSVKDTINSNLDDRATVADLFTVANVGINTRRIVRYGASTLNTPYKAGLTSDIDSGLAIISMSSSGNYGSILCIPEGGTVTSPCICKKTQTWGSWSKMLTNADFITKSVNLNSITVSANAGATGTTDVASQIPAGYKILDAKEVGSGNNGCYVYYFKVDGTNITLQIRNVTNATITTSLAAKLLLIPK